MCAPSRIRLASSSSIVACSYQLHLYATAGIPITWDQGSSSIVPSLPGFQRDFGITSGANPSQISNFISFLYLIAGVGAGLSFFINDRIRRIGPFTVTGPVSIVEIAPYEIRGLLATWFSVVMLLSLTVSCFVVYASFLHIAIGRLQYQVVWFVPCIVIAIIIGLSFFAMSVSPRWLMLAGREEEAVETLVALRGLPAAYLRIIQSEHVKYRDAAGDGIKTVLPEIFLVPANLRRVQQAYLSYSLAQLSGVGRSTDRSMFLTGMYSMSKFYTLIASFIFIDALGRRKSLFVGISVQMISDIYIGVFLKYKQAGSVAPGSSEGAIAAIYIHGFGYAVFSSSHRYVFGAELSPNNITSFGSALTQTFHWLFYPGVNKGTPSTKGDLMPVGVYVPDAGKELGVPVVTNM
ncbi:MFS quinate transporter [Paraphaeosphaeria minitans]|uniref:MFS quinate transporter n=1 Tax=Paraphaeosphaeria minitans TaxID=565426 RepID=A0A9P6KP61_9PLEO|nr:MFS quinate transporter [Paraphaeosphaeria minitans]